MVQRKRRRGIQLCIIVLLSWLNLVWLGVLWTRAQKETQQVNLILPQIASKSHEKVDWRSSLREFEGRGSSRFEDNLLHQRDELRAEALSAAAAGIDPGNTATTSNANNAAKRQRTFLKAPPDQSIDFLVPFLSPPITTAASSTTTIILVPSHQGSFVKRQAIRETWKAGANEKNSSTMILFVVAHSDCQEFNLDLLGADATTNVSPETSTDLTNQCDKVDHNFLKLEQEQNHDLLEIPMREDYRRLSEKMMQAYHWAVQTLPNLKWIAKADDDMFVNVQNFEDFLKQYNSETPTVIGEIIHNSLVAREGKWADPDYPNTYYPNWAKGSAGHVLSRSTVDYLIKNSESLYRYQGEDTNIGIWLDEATVSGRLNDVTFIDAPDYFISSGSLACSDASTAIMIGHELTPNDQVRCQKEIRKRKSGLDFSGEA